MNRENVAFRRRRGGTSLVLSALLLGACLLLPGSGEAQIVAGAPILVSQPAFPGSNFYVYTPAGIPAGWAVTYDGFLVAQTPAGTWIYGNCANGIALPTACVVGTASPAAFGLTPYMPLATAPPPPPPACAGAPVPVVPLQPSVYVPAWLTDPNFCAVSQWGLRVDRMALLDKPRLPVAWRGTNPEVIFGWTGRYWYQMRVRSGATPLETLAENLYALTMFAGENGGYRWNDLDTPILANQATVWGFMWLGRLTPGR
jgi:hypothetical protein